MCHYKRYEFRNVLFNQLVRSLNCRTRERQLTRTLYRQLVVGVALIMALFAWEMTRRQESIEQHQRTSQAIALAEGLAASSSVWVASRDFNGLQEIVMGLARYPDLRHALVIDTRGQVLAHLDSRRRGQYLSELPAQVQPTVLQLSDSLIDVSSPVMLSDRHVGWVRVGLACDGFKAELVKVKRDALLYTLFAIALGVLFASHAVRYLTQRLHAVEQIANAVQRGQTDLRAALSGDDEAAQLARHFNAMLDRLVEREEALKESEALLNATQHLSRIGGWQWDLAKKTMTWTPETYRIHDMVPELAAENIDDHIERSAACYLPEDRETILSAFWLCVEKGEPYDMEVPFITLKQRHLWLRTIGQAVHREDKIVKVIGYIMDITERKTMEDEIKNLAFFDPLTQLPNRRMFADRLGMTMSASERSGEFGALMYIDLDNFKPVNDIYGHAAGDLLLIEVAGRLSCCVRKIDTVARMGGDAFVVILCTLDADETQAQAQARQIAEKILMTVSEPYRLTLSHQGKEASQIEYHCTASMGVVVFMGNEVSQTDITRWGDAAMYQAKEAGRNRIIFHVRAAAASSR